jgi:hypothetical protein
MQGTGNRQGRGGRGSVRGCPHPCAIGPRMNGAPKMIVWVGHPSRVNADHSGASQKKSSKVFTNASDIAYGIVIVVSYLISKTGRRLYEECHGYKSMEREGCQTPRR